MATHIETLVDHIEKTAVSLELISFEQYLWNRRLTLSKKQFNNALIRDILERVNQLDEKFWDGLAEFNRVRVDLAKTKHLSKHFHTPEMVEYSNNIDKITNIKVKSSEDWRKSLEK